MTEPKASATNPGFVQPAPSAVQKHWMVPFGRNRDFIRREPILAQLLDRALPSRDKESCQRTVVEGLGGVGKTQIVLEVAFRLHDQCSVFWVPAFDAPSFENAYREIGRRMNVKGIEGDKADVKLLVKTALSHESSGSWLLIIDNADDVELLFDGGALNLSEYLPFSLSGSILVTTRTHEIATRLDISRRNVISLAGMIRAEATELLEKNVDDSQMDASGMAELLEFLADLPLAIKQASAYMAKTGMSVAKYLHHCHSSDKTLIKLLGTNFEDQGRYKSIQNPIATTWLVSFNQISRDNSLAASYLRFASLLAEKNVPLALLPEANDELEKDEAIGALKSFAFIAQREGEDSFDMHRLVRLAMRNWMNSQGGDNITGVILRLGHCCAWPEKKSKEVWKQYLPHINAALNFGGNMEEEAAGPDYITAKIDLITLLADWNFLIGRYEDAVPLHRLALEMKWSYLGVDNDSTVEGMNRLGDSLDALGRLKEAEGLYRKALSITRRTLGPRHPRALSTMYSLADTISYQGAHQEAEELYRQALKGWEETVGTECVEAIRCMNGIGKLLRQQGKYEESKRIHRQTLMRAERALGTEDWFTIRCMGHLAYSLLQLNEYDEAEQLYRWVFQLCSQVMGAQHPNTIGCLGDLGGVLERKGDYQGAGQEFRKALELANRALGESHRTTKWIGGCLRRFEADQEKRDLELQEQES